MRCSTRHLKLQANEKEGKNAQRLAMKEEFKSMPFAAVWNMLCEKAGVPVCTA
jgi:L-rhamnose isomerase